MSSPCSLVLSFLPKPSAMNLKDVSSVWNDANRLFLLSTCSLFSSAARSWTTSSKDSPSDHRSKSTFTRTLLSLITVASALAAARVGATKYQKGLSLDFFPPFGYSHWKHSSSSSSSSFLFSCFSPSSLCVFPSLVGALALALARARALGSVGGLQGSPVASFTRASTSGSLNSIYRCLNTQRRRTRSLSSLSSSASVVVVTLALALTLTLTLARVSSLVPTLVLPHPFRSRSFFVAVILIEESLYPCILVSLCHFTR
mmetsp:Transcript_6756/g.12370  ORF Transcript_6756/g.12370 Transcript_6756/m.12370 type:complete len:258 (-) Transcript_6756:94-867(-)